MWADANEVTGRVGKRPKRSGDGDGLPQGLAFALDERAILASLGEMRCWAMLTCRRCKSTSPSRSQTRRTLTGDTVRLTRCRAKMQFDNSRQEV